MVLTPNPKCTVGFRVAGCPIRTLSATATSFYPKVIVSSTSYHHIICKMSQILFRLKFQLINSPILSAFQPRCIHRETRSRLFMKLLFTICTNSAANCSYVLRNGRKVFLFNFKVLTQQTFMWCFSFFITINMSKRLSSYRQQF